MMTDRKKRIPIPLLSVQPRASTGQQGMALVLVLWLVVLVSLLATGHARNAHTEISLASRQIDTAKARALAEAGAQRAILDLMSPGTERQWPVDGSVQSFRFEGHDIAVAIRDATGLVDLNLANAVLLSALLTAADVDQMTQRRLVDAILDWRDADDLVRLNGAEDDDYLAAGLSWTTRGDAFGSVDELSYVMGMTAPIFERIAPYLTVYSNRWGVNLEYAPPGLIAALTGQEIQPVRDSVASAAGTAARGSDTYHIRVSAAVGDGALASLETVVRISPAAGQPYDILYWREPMRVSVAQPAEDLQ